MLEIYFRCGKLLIILWKTYIEKVIKEVNGKKIERSGKP